jgi:RNA polymerase sigma-70 factor (ECF subfamily)
MPPPQVDATLLLDRARQRDPAAAEALVDHLYPAVIAVVRRRLPRGTDEQDLAQEVFLRIFSHLDSFRGDASSLEAWARRIAFTTCLNALRHRHRRPECHWTDLSPGEQQALEASTLATDPPTPDQGLGARELLDRLLSTLDPADRSLIEWVDLEQRTPAEVRELSGWSAVNIRVRLFRARRKLRQALAQLQEPHESP